MIPAQKSTPPNTPGTGTTGEGRKIVDVTENRPGQSNVSEGGRGGDGGVVGGGD